VILLPAAAYQLPGPGIAAINDRFLIYGEVKRPVSATQYQKQGILIQGFDKRKFLFYCGCRLLFSGRSGNRIFIDAGQQEVRVTIVTIAAGQCVSTAYRALVMTMYVYQYYLLAAKKTLLRLHLFLFYGCVEYFPEQVFQFCKPFIGNR
jgi:hypothetical protein